MSVGGVVVPWWGWVISTAVAALVVDRVMLLLEERGFVYWRRKQAMTGSASAAMLSVQSLLEPGAEYVVEERVRAAAEIEEAADDEPLAPI